MKIDNPFYILDAAMSDSKAVIHEKAEEKSFTLSEEDCRKAEQILINPRKRISAEASWFPGMGAKKVQGIFQQLDDDMKNLALHFARFNMYPKLSYANIIALYLLRFNEVASEYEFEDIGTALKMLVIEFCSVVSAIDVEETFDLINHERISAGFPVMTNFEDFESVLEERMREFKTILLDFLGAIFDLFEVADILSSVIESVTKKGANDCPWQILTDLILDYEMKAIPEFEKQEKAIDKEIEHLKRTMGESNIVSIVLLKSDVKIWDRLAQPIQVLLRSQGKDHQRTETLSNKLRKFAVYAHNECHRTDISLEVTRLQERYFSELRGVSEKMKDDASQLEEIAQNQKEEQRRKSLGISPLLERLKGGHYSHSWGMIFKKSVEIDVNNLTINGYSYKVANAESARWKMTRNYTNGIHTGDTFKVVVRFTDGSSVRVPVPSESHYHDMTDVLLRTVGVVVMQRWLREFQKNRVLKIAGINVYNDGIELTTSALFSWKKKKFGWRGVRHEISEGEVHVKAFDKEENRTFEETFNYGDAWGSNILCTLINIMENSKVNRITSALGVE